jgi:hypothetical protein
MQGVRSRKAPPEQALDQRVTGRPRVLHDAGAIDDHANLKAAGILSASPAITSEGAGRIRLDASDLVFLQSLAETGFFGGGLLIVLVITCLAALVPIARQDQNAALMLCCVAYMIIIMAALGQLSGSGEPFLLLGATAGMI